MTSLDSSMDGEFRMKTLRRKKDILMSCKTKFGPCDNWLTTKWDVYPIIKFNKIKINMGERVVVL